MTFKEWWRHEIQQFPELLLRDNDHPSLYSVCNAAWVAAKEDSLKEREEAIKHGDNR